MGGLELRVLSVNVGQPASVQGRDGTSFLSAFQKRTVTGDRIAVRSLGLAGDAQANLEKHGGPDRAVYAYPSDNWRWWEEEKQFPCAAGVFGENLTLEGADEEAIRIGDRFSWGETLLEVSQPRTPCHKFQLFSGREDASTLMTLSGRCGWHFRVLKEGGAPVREGFLSRVARSEGPNVRELFLAGSNRRLDPARRLAFYKAPALAEAWQRKFAPE